MFIQKSQQILTIKDIMKMLHYCDNITMYDAGKLYIVELSA